MSKKIISTYERSIKPLKDAVSKGRVTPIGGVPRLFFLCGANESSSSISYRRRIVSNFLEKYVDNAHVVIAESFFDEYIKNSPKKNALDFEHVLSDVSEAVIIVMESPSAICELGAFAHKTLRRKLIVINDARYKGERSFINTGPIEAIRESVSDDRVIWYKMSDLDSKDGIATTFPKIKKLLGSRANDKKITSLDADLSLEVSSKRIFLLHDIIFLLGETTYSGLIATIKDIFGQGSSYDNVKAMLSILISLGFVDYPERFGVIRSNRVSLFYRYSDDDMFVKKGLFLVGLKDQMRA